MTAPSKKSEAERRLTLLLGTLLVANPAILFLLTRSVLVACGITTAAVLATQLIAFRHGWRLAAAYLFNVLAILSLFVHAEVILLYAFPQYVVENLYTIENGYYSNRPFLDQTFSAKEYSIRYRTNAQGLRIGEAQDPSHTYTVADWLVVGDSFTQGAQVEYSQLYTTILNQRFPDKIIVNAGISGLGIGHEYNYYAQAGHRLSPDLIILQLCSFNDFTNVEPSLVGVTDRLMTHSAFLRFLLADLKFTNPASLPLGRWTEPFHPDPQNNTDFNVFYKDTSPTKERDLRAVGHYLERLRDAIEARGAKLLVVLIPTKEQAHTRYLEEVLQAFSIRREQLDMHRPNTFLAELSRQLRIDVLDLLLAFQSAETDPFLQYDEHLSPAGHEVMATAIAGWVEARYGATPVRVLSRDADPDRYPMLSQDGHWITYQSFRDGNSELFMSTADMANRRRLTFNDVDESHPMLSRDASQILFTEGAAETHRTDVAIMNLDGSKRQHITVEPNVFGAIATFSPSSTSITYAEWMQLAEREDMTKARVVVRDVISGTKRYLTPPDRESWRPVFSPDGKTVFYISKTDGQQFDLYSHDLVSGHERQLSRTPFDEWDPQISPDGRHLVYAAKAEGNWDLFTLELESGRVQRLTATKGDEWDPYFSRDAKSILYAGRFGLVEALFEMPWRAR